MFYFLTNIIKINCILILFSGYEKDRPAPAEVERSGVGGDSEGGGRGWGVLFMCENGERLRFPQVTCAEELTRRAGLFLPRCPSPSTPVFGLHLVALPLPSSVVQLRYALGVRRSRHPPHPFTQRLRQWTHCRRSFLCEPESTRLVFRSARGRRPSRSRALEPSPSCARTRSVREVSWQSWTAARGSPSAKGQGPLP